MPLRVADAAVGELRYRPRSGTSPDQVTTRMVATLLALELERSRSPEWESDRLAGDFVSAVLAREVTDRGDIIARAAEHGAALDDGAGMVIARAAPHAPQTEEWRERVLTLATRALRAASRGSLTAGRDGEVAEVAAVVPCPGEDELDRAAAVLGRELTASLEGFAVTVARSRWTADPVDLYRAGKEALLAANVGEAEGRALIAFEETGAYRLLLPAMSEDPARARALLRGDGRPARRVRRPVRDRPADDGRDLPRQRRQRDADRGEPVHPPPHRALPPRAGEGARRPRHLLDRGSGEAQPRAQGDAGAGDRVAARPGDRARNRGRPGASPSDDYAPVRAIWPQCGSRSEPDRMARSDRHTPLGVVYRQDGPLEPQPGSIRAPQSSPSDHVRAPRGSEDSNLRCQDQNLEC